MKNFKPQPTLIRLQEFRIFFQEDVMFSVSGKPFHYLSVNALSDWDAILSAHMMFPTLTVRRIMKYDHPDWFEIA